jgi:hypothetical protein
VDEEAYFETIMPNVVEKIRKLIEGLDTDDLLGLPITDLLIMAYGVVLEETTRYTRIKSYRADFKPSFEELIGESRDVILKEVVKKLTGMSPSMLGPEASFAPCWKDILQGEHAFRRGFEGCKGLRPKHRQSHQGRICGEGWWWSAN